MAGLWPWRLFRARADHTTSAPREAAPPPTLQQPTGARLRRGRTLSNAGHNVACHLGRAETRLRYSAGVTGAFMAISDRRHHSAKFRTRAERATLPGLREGYNHLASNFEAAAPRLEAAENAAKLDPKDDSAG
jgi:hypothetical protein